MAKLSDLIEQILKQMIDENDGVVEITRGELADRVNCVPSQITYVLTTRFTNGQGYLVESRRGGGGWIRIKRVYNNQPASTYLMHVINSLGDSLSQQEVQVYIQNFVEQHVMNEATGKLLLAAVGDQSLGRAVQPLKDKIRNDIFQNLLVQLVINEEQEKKGGEDYAL